MVVAVRVKPRAPQMRVEGERAGRLLVQVTAPPLDGRANEALCKLLAKTLNVAPSDVSVVGGERARDKLVKVENAALADVAARLGVTA